MQLQTKSRSVRTYDAPEAELFVVRVESSLLLSTAPNTTIDDVDVEDLDW